VKKSRYPKYELYESSVQAAEDDVPFLSRIYKRERGQLAKRFREDFCGTFWICSEWVKSHAERTAVGVDISTSPTDYGMEHHYAKLSEDQQSRVEILHQDVRKVSRQKFDLICALNFSYFIFKRRETLCEYFRAVRKSLGPKGIFVADHFGGPANLNPQVEARQCQARDGRKFRYYWEQATFNPITSEAKFHIHFSTPDRVRIDRAFTYDWRMWSIPEITEIMLEAGFKETKVYWEFGGEFRPTTKGEDDCDVWICYIVGLV
jgi:cyclopropane fatty-acyl-phospholipid synthase-like methyltransferase